MNSQEFVSIFTIGQNYTLPEIVVTLVGPKGGTRALESITAAEARRVAAALIEAAARLDGGKKG